ncbi:ADP-ribosylglycohydrolase family protein [Microcoleus sp.]|uniref:ADP-ribosylglycohydrolase family protein n=1 Tax=Microcoleus sp. TaxID=44472 RepID=UPI0035247418
MLPDLILAVNLGDDADTTGAVYGQLAGAFYGEGGLPEKWRSQLVHLDTPRRERTGILGSISQLAR